MAKFEIVIRQDGKVVCISDRSWGVEFLEYHVHLHDLGGYVKHGHGYWVPDVNLKLID